MMTTDERMQDILENPAYYRAEDLYYEHMKKFNAIVDKVVIEALMTGGNT